MDKRKKKTKEETIEIAKVNLKKLPIKFELFNLLFLALLGISFFVFVYFVWKVNILPTTYLIGGFLGIFVLLIVIIGMMFFTKQKKLRIPSYVLTVLLSALMLGSVPYLQGTFHFLSNTQVKDYGVLHYSVVVLKGEEYNNIKSLEGKTIS